MSYCAARNRGVSTGVGFPPEAVCLHTSIFTFIFFHAYPSQGDDVTAPSVLSAGWWCVSGVDHSRPACVTTLVLLVFSRHLFSAGMEGPTVVGERARENEGMREREKFNSSQDDIPFFVLGAGGDSSISPSPASSVGAFYKQRRQMRLDE